MKKGFATLLVGLLAAGTVLAQRPPIVQLSTEGEAVLHVAINGFPILADTSSFSTVPINVHLIPDGNRLTMKGQILGDGGTLSVRVAVYQAGMMTGDDGAVVLFEQTFTRDEQALDLDTTFDLPDDWGDRVAFGRRYTDASAVEDENTLRDYALHLAALFKQGDMEAFYQEFKPKLDDYAAAAGADPAQFKTGFTRAAAGFREAGMKADFAREEVALTSWADGRVWEVSVEGQEALFEIYEDGGYARMKVYVALVDGALRVIR